MTSLKTSSTSSLTDPFICPQCQAQMTLRPLAPYPVWIQFLFGVSFLLLLFFGEKAQNFTPYALWLWTAIQILLGFLLMKGRIRASRKVYRCVRCSADL